jgi:hypothetical protein
MSSYGTGSAPAAGVNAGPEEKQGPAVGTIVWGAVVIAVGALMLANRLGWLTVDPGFAAAGVLLLAGLGLVIGGLLASRRKRGPADDAGTASAGGQAAGDGLRGSGPYTTD